MDLLKIMLLSFLIFYTLTSEASDKNKTLVIINNLELNNGEVILGFYKNEHDFLTFSNPAFMKTFKIKGTNKVTGILDDIPNGEYAIAGFHDLNGNGVLDFGPPYGAPIEPTLFGNNAKGIYGPPAFSEVKVVVGVKGVNLELSF